jgi:hypothetical protein
MTPEGSTLVDIAFTGTTSSISRTVTGNVAVVAVVRHRVSRRKSVACAGRPLVSTALIGDGPEAQT